MPKDNIKRAIEKGSGTGETGALEEIVLEGYGPGGVAILVEAMSDNRNRTVSDVRHACLTSETVLFLLSDIASTKIATPPGPYPSNTISSRAPVSPVPEPFSIALLILSLGIFAAFALSKASLL